MGKTTGLYEQALYKKDPVKYTVLVLRDMVRFDALHSDKNMEVFSSTKTEKLLNMSDMFANLDKSMGMLGLHVENGSIIRLNNFKKAVNFKRLFKCLASQQDDFDAILGIQDGLFRPTYLNEM